MVESINKSPTQLSSTNKRFTTIESRKYPAGKIPEHFNIPVNNQTTISQKAHYIQFTSSMGDTAQIQIDSIEFQKSLIAGKSNFTDDEWKKIITQIKDEYSQQKMIVSHLSGGKINQNNISGESLKIASQDQITDVPEYWNAENTSQRIADFALSFFESSGSDAQKYYDTVVGAIEKGFNQAMKIMGTLPEEINALAQSTFNKTMEKIDIWAREHEISTKEV